MGTTIINQYCYLFIFDVSLYLEGLWSIDVDQCMIIYCWSSILDLDLVVVPILDLIPLHNQCRIISYHHIYSPYCTCCHNRNMFLFLFFTIIRSNMHYKYYVLSSFKCDYFQKIRILPEEDMIFLPITLI
jgi:hypothetical protein